MKEKLEEEQGITIDIKSIDLESDFARLAPVVRQRDFSV